MDKEDGEDEYKDSLKGPAYLSTYVGLFHSMINYTEEINRQSLSAASQFFGLRFSGFVGMPIDFNFGYFFFKALLLPASFRVCIGLFINIGHKFYFSCY